MVVRDPESTTATTMLELPVVRSQASGASMSLSLAWCRPQSSANLVSFGIALTCGDVVRLGVGDVGIRLERADRRLDGHALGELDEIGARQPERLGDVRPLVLHRVAALGLGGAGRVADDHLARDDLGAVEPRTAHQLWAGLCERWRAARERGQNERRDRRQREEDG